MEKITIEIDIKDWIIHPSLKNFGSMIDDITNLQCEFCSGNVYGIIGECGSGGWGLSYILAGKDTCPQQMISINNSEIYQKDLARLGWYVGEGITGNDFFGREKSILRQLQLGIKQNVKDISIEGVIQKFNLSQDRLNLKLSEMSWEKWRASVAIGYANGKKIFCFPWLNTAQVNDLILNTGFHIYVDILKQEGAIIIVPTDKKETLEFIADKYVILNNPRHTIAKTTKELLEKYVRAR